MILFLLASPIWLIMVDTLQFEEAMINWGGAPARSHANAMTQGFWGRR